MKIEKIFWTVVILFFAWVFISTGTVDFIMEADSITDFTWKEIADHFEGKELLPPSHFQEEPEKTSELDKRVYESKRKMTVIATAYYGPLPGQNEYATDSYRGDIEINGTGVTRSGKEVRVGHIAADWSVLPEGTEVYVPGYGDGVVEDTGGAIQGKRIDLFMGYGQEGLERALEWGRRTVTITVQN